MLKFLSTFIKHEKLKYISVTLIFSILSIFEYIIFNINFSDALNYMNEVEQLIINSMILLLMTVNFMTLLLVNNFFTKTKQQEFSIIMLSGRNMGYILRYLGLQYGTLLLLTIPSSLVLGYIGTEFIKSILINVHGITINYQYIKGIGLFLLLLLIKFIWLLMINFGVFQKIERQITSILSIRDSNYKSHFIDTFYLSLNNRIKGFRKLLQLLLKYLKILYNILIIIMTFLPIYLMIISTNTNGLQSNFILSTFGLILMLSTTLPFIFNTFHKTFFLKKPIWLITISNVIDISKSMSLIIYFNLLLMSTITVILARFTTNKVLELFIIVCYLMLLVMAFTCITFYFSLLIPRKKIDWHSLVTIGFTNKQMHTVATREINILYFFTVLFPMIICSILLFKSNNISTNILILISSTYVIALISSYSCTTYMYCYSKNKGVR